MRHNVVAADPGIRATAIELYKASEAAAAKAIAA